MKAHNTSKNLLNESVNSYVLCKEQKNKFANKSTKVTKTSPGNTLETFKSETEIAKERKISPEERQKIIKELRLVL